MSCDCIPCGDIELLIPCTGVCGDTGTPSGIGFANPAIPKFPGGGLIQSMPGIAAFPPRPTLKAGGEEANPGTMPAAEQVILARHLMHHGIIGKAKPGKGGGQYSDRFDAAEYIAAARVHLGLSSADAEGLSMTEFQTMLAMKYPESQEKQIPSRDEYRKAMQSAHMKEKRNG